MLGLVGLGFFLRWVRGGVYSWWGFTGGYGRGKVLFSRGGGVVVFTIDRFLGWGSGYSWFSIIDSAITCEVKKSTTPTTPLPYNAN